MTEQEHPSNPILFKREISLETAVEQDDGSQKPGLERYDDERGISPVDLVSESEWLYLQDLEKIHLDQLPFLGSELLATKPRQAWQ